MLTAAKRVDELARTYEEAGQVKTYREGLAMVKLKEPSLWGDYLKESGVRADTGKAKNPAQRVDDLAAQLIKDGLARDYRAALSYISVLEPALWKSYNVGGR